MKRRRSPARFLGPIALIVVIAAIAYVVKDGMKDSGTSSTTTTRTTKSGRVVTTSTTTTVKQTGPASYTIASGDTLLIIAKKTHIPVGRLQAYNPDIDASALVVGQKLKLRRTATP